MQGLYNYTGQHESELDFVEGDIILILETDDSGWYSGFLGGSTGFFPIAYAQDI
jgi:hypothetical protein